MTNENFEEDLEVMGIGDLETYEPTEMLEEVAPINYDSPDIFGIGAACDKMGFESKEAYANEELSWW